MKIKTSELTGLALCYAVCMIELPHLVWGKTIGLHEHSKQIIVPELKEPDCYSPFMSWAQGGPIIEREKIELVPSVGGTYWYAESLTGGHRAELCNTPLIAAMRCFVLSKLGEEVDIPQELLSKAPTTGETNV